MSTLIDQLKRFNRKERFFLVGLALDNPDFTLGAKFRAALGDLFKPKITIPPDAFVAMDYHLEWLYAAVRAAQVGQRYENTEKFVKGNQEDVDLIVAFDDGDEIHIVLVEAKGETAWGNKQMQSKADRLKVVFNGVDGKVVPHFAFASPRPPQHLIGDRWPEWINTKHHLAMRVLGDLKVTRCTAEGIKSAQGGYWMIAQA